MPSKSAATAPADTNVVDIKAPRTAVVTFGGETYAIPKDRGEWSIEVMEALEAQPMPRQVEALRLILGDEQWTKWRARHKSMEDVDNMYGAIGEATGGNS